MKYYIDSNNFVYSSSNDTYLFRLSPLVSKNDKKVIDFNISGLNQIKKKLALEIVNKQFDNISKEWEFNGNKYNIYDSNNNYATYLNNRGNRYEFTEEIKIGNKTTRFHTIYYIGWFQGKVYWLSLEKFPRIKLYKFNDINIGPTMYDFIQFTSAKHCKIVFKNNNKL